MKSRSPASNIYSYSPPYSKSIANRALILAALSKGKSRISRVPYGDDVDYMLQSLEKLGCTIAVQKHKEARTVTITGLINKVDQKSRKRNAIKLFTGNAGTTTRFILTLSTLLNKKIILEGQPEMEARPLASLVTALNGLGAHITYNKKRGHMPVTIHPSVPHGGTIHVDTSQTSQFASALALIAPMLKQETTIILGENARSESYLKTTLEMLREWNIKYEQKNRSIKFHPQQVKGRNYRVQPDIASASYIIAIAILNCTKILVKDMYLSPLHSEREFMAILEAMGCTTEQTTKGILITPPKKQKKIKTINASNIPDTALTLCALKAITGGKTRFTHIGHLKYKETNRLKALHQELRHLGSRVKIDNETLEIWGTADIHRKANIQTYKDHRMALAFSIIKSQFPEITIKNPEVVQKSYPKYWNDYRDMTLQLNTNIVLIGLPGSGKTSLAKRLARRWKYNVIDFDEVFNKQTGKTIAAYVEEYGWEKFRAQETKILKKFEQKSRSIIATGGGIVLKERNFLHLRKLGIVVYLEMPLKDISTRIEQDPHTKNQRPNFKDRTRTTLQRMYQERSSLYQACCHISLSSAPETENITQDLDLKIQELESKLFYT